MILQRKCKALKCTQPNCRSDEIVEVPETGELTCKCCGVVQKSHLSFIGDNWENQSTTHVEQTIKSKDIDDTCKDIDFICEKLVLDSSIAVQAKGELDLYYKVCLCSECNIKR
jgi:transcription initiation factor TFIIIB Brf1 subunit/transcription initiation factor TFIIB